MKATKKYEILKEDNPEIHKKYEMFRRLDTHLWDRNKFLLGAIFLFGIKITGVLLSLLFCYFGLKIFVKPTDNKNDPQVKKKIDFFTMNGAKFLLFFFGIFLQNKKAENVDYTKYLGENYIKDENKNKQKEAIVLGETLDIIIQKQKDIYSGKDLSKFMIFPEGTTSNNTGILDFKRGAFLSELAVKPYIIKFDTNFKISLAMDVIEMLYHLFLVICVPFHLVEVIELPVFVPNENLFKDSNKERWVQYAEAVKDVMSEASGLKNVKGSYKEKKEYLDFLRDKNRGKLN